MGSPQLPDFEQLIAGLARELVRARVPFMLIGGQAVLLHGAPRATEDIDVTLGVDPTALATIQGVCNSLGLVPLPTDLEAFVAETFVLPAREQKTSTRVDFIFSTTEFERQAIERAVRVPIGGERVPFATAEDLILHKLFAGRPRDIDDVAGVIARKGAELDWEYLERWAVAFAAIDGREGMPAHVAELRRRLK